MIIMTTEDSANAGQSDGSGDVDNALEKTQNGSSTSRIALEEDPELEF